MIDPKYINKSGHLTWTFFEEYVGIKSYRIYKEWSAQYRAALHTYLPYSVAIPEDVSGVGVYDLASCWQGQPSGAWRVWRHDGVTRIYTETEEDAIILRLSIGSGEA